MSWLLFEQLEAAWGVDTASVLVELKGSFEQPGQTGTSIAAASQSLLLICGVRVHVYHVYLKICQAFVKRLFMHKLCVHNSWQNM